MKILYAVVALLFSTTVHAQTVTPTTNGSAAPSGAAGGVLSGTYPNPGFAAGPTFVGPLTVSSGGAAITGRTVFSGSGGFYVSGSVATGLANATLMDYSSGTSRIFNLGADGSTLPTGGFNFIVAHSDTSGSSTLASLTASALTVNVGASFAGNSSVTGTFGVSSTVTFTGLTTGTNADTLCLSAGGVVFIQAAACTISSLRFKHDVEPISPSKSLRDIMKIRPISFVMNERNRDDNGNRLQVGMSAENIASIDRAMAIYEDDGVTPKSYRQEAVLAAAIGAIQALKADNDNLRSEVNKLKRKVR